MGQRNNEVNKVCLFPKLAIAFPANGVRGLGVLCSNTLIFLLSVSTKSLPEESLVKTSFRGPPSRHCNASNLHPNSQWKVYHAETWDTFAWH